MKQVGLILFTIQLMAAMAEMEFLERSADLVLHPAAQAGAFHPFTHCYYLTVVGWRAVWRSNHRNVVRAGWHRQSE